MKYIRLLFSISFLLMAWNSTVAQDTLTNRQIFNFEVGDIIHTSYYKQYSTTEYIKRQINSRSYSDDLDTVFFEVTDSVYRYSPPNGYLLSIENHTVFYSDLDSYPDSVSYIIADGNDTFSCGINSFEIEDISGFETNKINYSKDNIFNNLDALYINSAGMYYEFYFQSFEGERQIFEYLKLHYFKRGNSVIGEPITRNFDIEKQLTNREIYNFDIGDIFHYEYSSHNSSPIYTKVKVIGKEYNNKGDSVTYTFLDSIYTLASVPNWELEVEEKIIQYALDSVPVKREITDEFYYSIDSVTNIEQNTYFTYYGTNERKFMAGLGSIYSYHIVEIDHVNWGELKLLYFKKSSIEHGNRISLSIPNVVYNNFSIYPNPTTSEINISGISKADYSIQDMSGRTIQNGFFKNLINVSELKQGVYILTISTDNQRYIKKIVKE